MIGVDPIGAVYYSHEWKIKDLAHKFYFYNFYFSKLYIHKFFIFIFYLHTTNSTPLLRQWGFLVLIIDGKNSIASQTAVG